MSLANAALPTDPEALRAFALNLQSEMRRRENEVRDRDAELYLTRLHIEKLKAQLAILRRKQFGRSSEKLASEAEQLELIIGDLEEGQAEVALKKGPTASPSKPVRKPLPEHLPRETVIHDPACVCTNCGSSKLTKIGSDDREVLEYVPARFKVVMHSRPKLSCRDCEAIMQAPMPSLPIEKGMAGASVLAHVLISKYCDHLPLYRQSEIYGRENVDLERSTLAEWVGHSAGLLRPLAEAIAKHVKEGNSLHADDTPVPVLEPGKGQTKTGRLWVAVRDERPYGSAVPPAVFYQYSPDRKGERAEALLKGSSGYLHADGYAGFNQLYESNRFTEVACWAHVRRKIYDVHEETQSPLAKELLNHIANLFAIEAAIKGKEPDERRRQRQEQSLPLLETIKSAFEATLNKVSGKSTLAKAIRYALSRWQSLIRYTEDGRLEMTNNAAERAIRPLALGRKNWLFAGSDTGGERAATLYTIIETAKLSGFDPEAYLRDILSRIANHPINKIAALLPWNLSPRS